MERTRYNLSKILNISFIVLFGLVIFSIPVFSYNSGFSLITWILTAFLIVIVILDAIFIKKKVFADTIICSLFLFSISALISSFLNHFKGFVFTPILLSILSICIYHFLNEKDKKVIDNLLLSIFIATILFLFVYIIFYFEYIIKFDFSIRLGGELGDENDICIVNALGICFCLYFFLYTKAIHVKILTPIFAILFLICGFTSGSKIFLLLVFIVTLFLIIKFFGKKRFYFSLGYIGLLILCLVLVLTMPRFNSLKLRILSFLATILKRNIGGVAASSDLSTIDRVDMFSAAVQLFFRKPLFGFGIEGFSAYGGLNLGWSHNHISESLCNFGISGSFLYHLPILLVIVKKDFYKRENSGMFMIAIFFIVTMISIPLFSSKLYAMMAPIFFIFADSRTFFVVPFSRIEEKK